MKLEQIRTIAKSRGINPGKLNKSTLIHSIQSDEGNLACYSTELRGLCNQERCLWRDDCVDNRQDAG